MFLVCCGTELLSCLLNGIVEWHYYAQAKTVQQNVTQQAEKARVEHAAAWPITIECSRNSPLQTQHPMCHHQ